MPAVSNSSTTASGVTMPRGLRAIWVATVPAATRAAWPTLLVDVDRFITTNQASWSRLEQLTAAARLPSAPAAAGRGRRARAALPAGVRRTCPTPAPSTPTPRWSPASPGWSPASGGVLYGTRSRVAAGRRPLLHHELPGRGVARPPLRASRPRSLLLVPAVAGRRRGWPQSDAALEASAPDAAARGLRGGGLRGVLLVGAGRRVRRRRSRSTTSR